MATFYEGLMSQCREKIIDYCISHDQGVINNEGNIYVEISNDGTGTKNYIRVGFVVDAHTGFVQLVTTLAQLKGCARKSHMPQK